MFRVHSEVSLVELILLGVKAGLKKKGTGSASILKLNIVFSSKWTIKIMTYDDLRQLAFQKVKLHRSTKI